MCSVLPNLEVRIGDAALSCDLYPNEYHYHFNFGHAKVPLKWMPLECIEQGLFSGNSDVVSTCNVMCMKCMFVHCLSVSNEWYTIVRVHRMHGHEQHVCLGWISRTQL